ncbi:MAG: hypothetical protein JWM95_2354 [Gemmatimonadetes bacterium]|nr:hypothetical protein [Gemmatimonadota bacterium]
MSVPDKPTPDDEFRAYVAEHENAPVREYVDALYEERAELLEIVGYNWRTGVSAEGRVVLRTIIRVVMFAAVVVGAYFLGKLG